MTINSSEFTRSVAAASPQFRQWRRAGYIPDNLDIFDKLRRAVASIVRQFSCRAKIAAITVSGVRGAKDDCLARSHSRRRYRRGWRAFGRLSMPLGRSQRLVKLPSLSAQPATRRTGRALPGELPRLPAPIAWRPPAGRSLSDGRNPAQPLPRHSRRAIVRRPVFQMLASEQIKKNKWVSPQADSRLRGRMPAGPPAAPDAADTPLCCQPERSVQYVLQY